jgi:hypothetical protein
MLLSRGFDVTAFGLKKKPSKIRVQQYQEYWPISWLILTTAYASSQNVTWLWLIQHNNNKNNKFLSH